MKTSEDDKFVLIEDYIEPSNEDKMIKTPKKEKKYSFYDQIQYLCLLASRLKALFNLLTILKIAYYMKRSELTMKLIYEAIFVFLSLF